MSYSCMVDKKFTEAVNELTALYDVDELDECIAGAHELLSDSAIPRYHKMKTLLILASTAEDWKEANAYRLEIETICRQVRAWHPIGEAANIDEYLAEIRGTLDELLSVINEEEREEHDYEAYKMMADNEERVDDERAMEEGDHAISDDADGEHSEADGDEGKVEEDKQAQNT
ncbi:unnamed protein product [Periconia digitata]|uniref:Uncharacterized protein n=1 Tax=Periconia digitata TaxID=1303443 RepID=A0A9W4UJH1_9PLEO|nr:unnamed protein product [Periconia digitata]